LAMTLPMRFPRALYIGRFQPPHAGHLATVRYALTIASEVTIGIRDTRLSIKDPLTLGERVEAWQRLLESEGLADRVEVRGVPDFEKQAPPVEDKEALTGHQLVEWAKKVEALLGISPDDTVFVGNKPPMVVAFNLLGYIVLPGTRNLRRLMDISATKLRELVLRGDPSWKSLLPKPVATLLEEIGFRERLMALTERGL